MNDSDSLQPRKNGRRVATMLMWIIVLLIIVGILSPLRNALLNHFIASSPTPTATVAPVNNLIYVEGIPSGTIYIDERLLTHVPRVGVDPPIRLSPGQHLILWQAGPFPLQKCPFNVPNGITDPAAPCNTNTTIMLKNNVQAALITFSATLTALPAAQQKALEQSEQSALNSLQTTDTVLPGEQYALTQTQPPQKTTVQTATQPLKATLSYTLDTTPNAGRVCNTSGGDTLCQVDGQNCLQLCALSTMYFQKLPPSPPGNLNWNAVALFYPAWTYTTEDGHSIASNRPDPFARSNGDDHSVILHIRWDGKQWHTSIITDTSLFNMQMITGMVQNFSASFIDPACAAAGDGLNTLSPASEGGQTITLNWQFATGADRTAGCLGIATSATGSTTTKPSAAYVLYRFGVALAANALAHRYFPSLPEADAYEQAIAQHIATNSRL